MPEAGVSTVSSTSTGLPPNWLLGPMLGTIRAGIWMAAWDTLAANWLFSKATTRVGAGPLATSRTLTATGASSNTLLRTSTGPPTQSAAGVSALGPPAWRNCTHSKTLFAVAPVSTTTPPQSPAWPPALSRTTRLSEVPRATTFAAAMPSTRMLVSSDWGGRPRGWNRMRVPGSRVRVLRTLMRLSAV